MIEANDGAGLIERRAAPRRDAVVWTAPETGETPRLPEAPAERERRRRDRGSLFFWIDRARGDRRS